MRAGLPTLSIQRIAANTVWLFAGRVLAGMFHLLAMAWLGRLLGVSDYGKIIFAFTYVAIFNNLSVFGIDTVIIREISRDPSASKRLISCGMSIKFFFCLISILMALACLCFFDVDTDTYAVTCILLLTLFLNSLRTPKTLFEAFLKSPLLVAIEITNKAAALVAVAAAAILDLSLLVLTVIIALSELPSLALLLRLCKNDFKFSLRLDRPIAKFILRDAWQLGIMSILVVIYFRVDTLMLLHFEGNEAVGYYSAAYIILTSLMIVPDAFVRSIFPLMSNSFGKDPLVLERTFYRSLKYLSTMAFLVVLIGFMFSKDIILFLYGEKFLPSADALSVLIFAAGIIFISHLVSTTLTAVNRQKMNLLLSLTNLILNILLNLALIPTYGYIGAAVATVATEATGCAIALILNIRFFSLSLHLKSFLSHTRILAPITCAVMLFKFLPGTHFIVSAFFICLTYGTGLFLVRWFDVEDISLFKRMIKG
jgi:O-antigen/teichoic acid export membrane protein